MEPGDTRRDPSGCAAVGAVVLLAFAAVGVVWLLWQFIERMGVC